MGVQRKRKSKYQEPQMREVVSNAMSWAQVIEALGLKKTGGNYKHIQGICKSYQINSEHFIGAGWMSSSHPSYKEAKSRVQKSNAYTDEEVFQYGTVFNGSKLAARMRRLGIPYVCAECELSEWRGKAITLHVDHVNGDHVDNRLINLRFLCPNCHQQTETWGLGQRAFVERQDEFKGGVANEF